MNTNWSTTDKTAGTTVSGSNLTATFGGANNAVRAVDRQIAGKHYWETTFTTASASYGTGIAVFDAALAQLWASSPNAVTVYASGTIWVNGVSLGVLLGALSAGGVVVGHALDATGKLYWARNASTGGNWNGNAAANPATGVGGIALTGPLAAAALYPAACGGAAATVVNANFGDAAFTGAVPAGFTPGFTAGATIPLNMLDFGLARETIITATSELRAHGLMREVIGAPGVGSNRLLVQGLAREVIGGTSGGGGAGPRQYAVTVIT